MNKNEKTRPAGGTAERETAEKTAYKVSIPMSDCNTTAAGRQIKIAAFRCLKNILSSSIGLFPLSYHVSYAKFRDNKIRKTSRVQFFAQAVRLMIEQERRSGTPICTDNLTGYYLPATEEEKAACVRSMRHRAREIMKTARAIEQTEG